MTNPIPRLFRNSLALPLVAAATISMAALAGCATEIEPAASTPATTQPPASPSASPQPTATQPTPTPTPSPTETDSGTDNGKEYDWAVDDIATREEMWARMDGSVECQDGMATVVAENQGTSLSENCDLLSIVADDAVVIAAEVGTLTINANYVVIRLTSAEQINLNGNGCFIVVENGKPRINDLGDNNTVATNIGE